MRDWQNRKSRRRSERTGVFMTLMAFSLVLFTFIGGTVAWLIDDTDPVVNTFTYGDINIDLKETDTNKDGDDDPNTNDYPMIPGNPIEKDPKVIFKAESEAAWLFVKLEESDNFNEFMTYEIAEGWAALAGVDGVYYRTADKAGTDTEYPVIKDNTVNVNAEVTKEKLNELNSGGVDNFPTLTITAYAVQRDDNITTAADAWAKVPNSTNP